MNILEKYGYNDFFKAHAELIGATEIGRVIAPHRDQCQIITEKGSFRAEVSGSFRHHAESSIEFPTVGDFVVITPLSEHGNIAVINAVLPRKSSFVRKAAGTNQELQIVAANIDTLFICMAANSDFNLRRLERYLATSWDTGAKPAVILTKIDLCHDLDTLLTQINSVAIGVEIFPVSSFTPDSLVSLMNRIKLTETVALIGSSGVGKSTLINALIGTQALETQDIRKNEKGKHTTTHRELFLLPQGGMVIDTPGMRELGIDSADLAQSFGDVEKLAQKCRFSDCSHHSEPGCAVQKAILENTLDPARLANYQKLEIEAQYEGLSFKQIEQKKIDRMFAEVGGIKEARNFAKKNSRK